MAMYLGECPIYTIMMISRWSSNAFLRYTRKQIEQISHNLSCKMLRFKTHRHIPDLQRISHMDPRQRNHKDNIETRNNVGGNLSCRVQLPAFSLFNRTSRCQKEFLIEVSLFADRTQGRRESYQNRFQTRYTVCIICLIACGKSEEQKASGFNFLCCMEAVVTSIGDQMQAGF